MKQTVYSVYVTTMLLLLTYYISLFLRPLYSCTCIDVYLVDHNGVFCVSLCDRNGGFCICLGDRNGVLVLLLIPRLLAKTDLLINQIRDKV